ncbi:hypothetical protein FEAC_26280 [Ferrimicrobium acidiphilum DSM 19497]|uniref:Uncharacterized protein n=1 Tax=Ferrimicrobium acidiphilum DSM 19497 TaxID=1121877 RepID=A0A0D8FQW2_9ACTN|nr:hypothetical protein FEAC_26280 [Ferrimicrobium acidiphilum DSM 19497]
MARTIGLMLRAIFAVTLSLAKLMTEIALDSVSAVYPVAVVGSTARLVGVEPIAMVRVAELSAQETLGAVTVTAALLATSTAIRRRSPLHLMALIENLCIKSFCPHKNDLELSLRPSLANRWVSTPS